MHTEEKKIIVALFTFCFVFLGWFRPNEKEVTFEVTKEAYLGILAQDDICGIYETTEQDTVLAVIHGAKGKELVWGSQVLTTEKVRELVPSDKKVVLACCYPSSKPDVKGLKILHKDHPGRLLFGTKSVQGKYYFTISKEMKK